MIKVKEAQLNCDRYYALQRTLESICDDIERRSKQGCWEVVWQLSPDICEQSYVRSLGYKLTELGFMVTEDFLDYKLELRISWKPVEKLK